MRSADQNVVLGDDIEVGQLDLGEGVSLDAKLAAEIAAQVRDRLKSITGDV